MVGKIWKGQQNDSVGIGVEVAQYMTDINSKNNF